MPRPYQARKPSTLRKQVLFIVTFLCVLIGVVAILDVTNVTHFFHKDTKKYIDTPTTGGSSANEQKGEPSTGNNSGSQPTDNKGSSNDGSVFLLTPAGDFVSNHNPGSNGSPLSESSVCTTTPGATCQITFTKDGVTKLLPAQVTDQGGSSYWNNWTLQQYGLTPGSWQIKAVATLNGQTKTATDAINLTVPQ